MQMDGGQGALVSVRSRCSPRSAAITKPNFDPLDKRVRCDTRKWLMSKLAPGAFGDKITVAGDPAAPLGIGGALDLARLSDQELDLLEQLAQARLAAIAAAVERTAHKSADSTD